MSQRVAMRCGDCGQEFGLVPLTTEAYALVADHYEQCIEWKTGEGLIKMYPLAYSIVDAAELTRSA